MGAGDLPKIRKAIIRLSLALRTGIDFFYSLSVFELFDLMEEVAEVGKDKKRT